MMYFWLLLLAYLIFGLIHQNKGKTFGYKLDLFIDLFFGAAIWCEPGVTVSSEVGKAMERTQPPRWAKLLNGFLDMIQKGHCAKAILDDIIRAENSIAYLNTRQP
jgi:hypothetical protein